MRTSIAALALLALAARRGACGPDAVDVRFLDLAAARAAIVDDRGDPYFERMQPLEMAAKTGSPIEAEGREAQVAECRRRYQAGVLEFTDDEKARIAAAVRRVDAALVDYPLVRRVPWSHLKLSGTIEGGLPHTRGEHAVLTEPFLAMFASAPPTPASEHALASVLLHEHVHVAQRLHPKPFERLYTELWGFRRVPPIAETPWLVDHHLVNPDGADTGWVFPLGEGPDRRWIWPLVVLRPDSGVPRMPADFDLIGVRVREAKDGRFEVVGETERQPLLAIEGYADRFAGSANVYHPNEIVADLFPRMVLGEGPRRGSRPPAVRPVAEFDRLRAWCRANLR